MLSNNSNLILLLISIVIVILTVVVYLEFKKIKIESNELKKDIEVLKYNLMKIMQPTNLKDSLPQKTNITSDVNKPNIKTVNKLKKENKSIKKTLNTIEENIVEPTKNDKQIEKISNTDIDNIVESIVDFDIKDISNNIGVIVKDVDVNVEDIDVNVEDIDVNIEDVDVNVEDIDVNIEDVDVNVEDVDIDVDVNIDDKDIIFEVYKSKSVKELKEILENMDLKQTGNKTTLIQRIIDNLDK